MEVILSGWAWLPEEQMGEAAIKTVKDDLTMTPRVPADFRTDDGGAGPVFAFEEREGFMGVPRGYFMEKARLDHHIHDERSKGLLIEEERCGFLGSTSGHPRWDEHTKAMEAVLSRFSSGATGGIVRACPAWGKTGFAIRLICRVGRKTLVGVHKEFLVNQWKSRFEKFAPHLRVGVWRGKKMEVEDFDVVIGMVQTITKREVEREIADQFGLCVWDEVHRVGARTWSTVPPRFSPIFHLGLSAKPKRADRMDNLFLWHVGPVIYEAKFQTPVPGVFRIHTPYKKPDWVVKAENEAEAQGEQNPIKYPTQLKPMVTSVPRNERIVKEIEKILRTSNRKVVVMSERVAHLETMAELLRNRDLAEPIPDLSMGFYHSKVKVAARKDAERKRVIFATFQMLEEGFDVSALDTLIMTTARADVEQPVGRIRRVCVLGETVTESDCKYYCPWRADTCKSKPKPIVVEFTDDDVAVVQRKVKYRSRYYRDIGAKVLEGR